MENSGSVSLPDRVFPRLAGEFRRYGPLQCRVGTRLIIVLPPLVNLAFRVLQRQKPVRVQTLLAQSPIDSLLVVNLEYTPSVQICLTL
jgi:hypothetical protein